MARTANPAAAAMRPTSAATDATAMQYRVRAIDAQQQIQTLLLEALDDADARTQALTQRLAPISVIQCNRLAIGGAKRFPLLLFVQELQALLAAGLSVVEALETLIEKDPLPQRRAVLARLAQHLREGQRLSAAMRQQSAVFPPLFVGVVQAAENTSDLPRALSRYIEYEARLEAVRHQVVSAAIYPAILLVVGGAVSLFLLGYVVPRFASVYQSSGRELPWASQLLMAWGQFAGEHAAWLLTAFGAGMAAIFWFARRQIASGGWWRALRLLPGAKSRLDILELSRLYLTLGMLLEGGIAVQHALKLSAAVVDTQRQRALAEVKAAVQSGESMSVALEQHGLSTPVALRLLRVGEQSGQLGQMLTRTAAFYDGETTRWMERFTKTFEPVLMAAIGLVIGLIVILLYMPVFDLAGSLQ
jgi:general secretion pathway protein F